jgi:hypothetical protein
MRAKVAVATVQGKAYYLIVSELRRRNIPFLSLIPGQPVPVEIRVVITTPREQHLLNHEKVLVYDVESDPEIMGCGAVKVLLGKETYETVTVGVDPGNVFGLAVVADGAVIDTENYFSIKEVVDKMKSLLKTLDVCSSVVSVKVGSGVPVHKELLEALDEGMPSEVKLEVVSEAGTNRYHHEAKHRRGFRHMVSAVRIARRVGYVYERRKNLEQDR